MFHCVFQIFLKAVKADICQYIAQEGGDHSMKLISIVYMHVGVGIYTLQAG